MVGVSDTQFKEVAQHMQEFKACYRLVCCCHTFTSAVLAAATQSSPLLHRTTCFAPRHLLLSANQPDKSRLRRAGQHAKLPCPSGPCSGFILNSSVCRLSSAQAGTPQRGQLDRLQLLRHRAFSWLNVASRAGSRAAASDRSFADRSSLLRLEAA